MPDAMHDAAPLSAAPDGDTLRRAAESLLERRIGLDAQSIGSAAIMRAVRSRMTAAAEPDAAAYLARLDRDTDECDRLIDEVVVPESWFFRDPQVFAHLQRTAAAGVSVGRPPLRILSLPCASGEEPYSVAMALFEAGLAAGQFAIDAADVSRAAVARAVEARYSANAFRGPTATTCRRWFHDEGRYAVLDEVVRRQVRFTWGNLLDDSFVAARAPYDVVLCRNLLIYLSPAARVRAERALDRLIVPEGILVVGAAEPPILHPAWLPVAGNAVFALHRCGQAAASLSAASRHDAVPSAWSADVATAHAAERRAEVGRSAAPAPSPGVAVEPPAARGPTEAPPATEDLLRRAGALADDGRPREALAVCRRHLEAVGPCPRTYFLMGMLHQSLDELDRAEEHLHKAVYLDAHHDDALLALAVMATRRGDAALAERYRRSAGRALARKGDG